MSSRSWCTVLAVATAATAPQLARAQTVELHGDAVALALHANASSPSAPTIGSQADLTTTLNNIQTRVQFGVQTGAKATDEAAPAFSTPAVRSGSWSSSRVGLSATWAPTPLAKLELNADDRFRRDSDPTPSLWLGSLDNRISSRETEARVVATIAPLRPLNLQIGGETSSRVTQTSTISATTVSISDRLDNQSQRLFTAADWRLWSRLSIQGGAKLENVGVARGGAAGESGSFAFVEPQVGVTLTPWTGASWKLGVERVVSPMNPDQFALFSQVADRPAGATFEPDQEWRYQAALQHHLGGDVELSATFTRSRLESVTELAPVGGTQAPMSIGSGQRSQVEAAVAAPVRLFGLNALTLKAKGAWRTSQVKDPFTGALRRASGEAPYQAELSLSQAVPSQKMRWGLRAQANGPSTFYQMSQITTQSADPGLGGFIEYNPGPITVQLRLDNVVGGDRNNRDTYFAGARELSPVERIDRSHDSDRAIRISLTKPL